MATPMESYIKLQFALCASWARFLTIGSQACANAMEHQVLLFQHPRTIRSADVVPTGADWFDHYGRRHSDIDVDRV